MKGSFPERAFRVDGGISPYNLFGRIEFRLILQAEEALHNDFLKIVLEGGIKVKQKIGTALDEKVITALKVIAAKEKRRLSDVIEEALIQYLQRKRGKTVERTKGAIPASSKVVKAILDEESFYET